jgi:hypothetical protein
MSTQNTQIYELLPQVMTELSRLGIGKGQKNQAQGYSFRGMDQLLNVCGPLLASHGIFVRPLVQSCDFVQRGDNGKMTHARVVMNYFFTAPDSSYVQVSTIGEAMDSSDKAANKAMSAALKYALVQTFLIPIVGNEDADFHSPEVEAPAVAAKLATKPLEAVDRVELSLLQAKDKETLEGIVATIRAGNWTEDEKARLREAHSKRVKEVQ